MSTIQYSESSPLVLTGDIGGTNTTLALVERLGPSDFTVLDQIRFGSKELSSIEEGLEKALTHFVQKNSKLNLKGICLSGAGPVSNNLCHTSNLPWDIDGDGISNSLGIPTLVINDFSAICYGVPLLNPANPKQLIPLNHPDGSFPKPQEFRANCSVQAVVGAGTGLGIGYLIKDRGHYTAHPSEGGHSDFGAYDDRTRELQSFLHEKWGINAGTEQYVSGQGIVNIHEFLSQKQENPGIVSSQILSQPRDQRAPLISEAAKNDQLCQETMKLFVEMYARFASTIALTFLPKGGLYLAGGIASKNLPWFTEENRFMVHFLKNYKQTMGPALSEIPVYIVDDYGISLPGAALGFFALTG